MLSFLHKFFHSAHEVCVVLYVCHFVLTYGQKMYLF